MKTLLYILVFFCAPQELMAQLSKFYYTGRINSNFNRELIDESRQSRPVPDPLESINSIHISVGRKIGEHLRPELGFSIIHQSSQREAFDLVVKHTDLLATIKFGIIDSLGLKSTYIISPYFSITRGRGFVLSNGTKADDMTVGVIAGMQLALHKNIIKKIGVQPILHIQYEHYQNYRGVNNGPKISKEYGKIFPSLNLTYNF